MATPFKVVSSGVRDAYNFYHSQLNINIECAFGMLVNRWAILRTPIPLNISLYKTAAFVRALCCLRNYLIDKNPLVSTISDRRYVMSRGGKPLHENNSDDVEELLSGGDHSDDFNQTEKWNQGRRLFRVHQLFPREYLLNWLEILGTVTRPKPMGTTTTNTNL